MRSDLKNQEPHQTGSKSDTTNIDGQKFKELVIAGMTWLKTNHANVNALNVFPVPDGDTGTNMLLTMQAAFDEIATSGEKNIGKIAHDVAQGALIGARGNSGVILSQLWRGFARGLDSLETMDVALMANAFAEASKTAYKGVVRPVEGTILTVAKDTADAVQEALPQTISLKALLEIAVEAANKSVLHTPELLPILKKAGVVDSGGKGFFFILEGMLRYLNNQSLETAEFTVQPLSSMEMDDAMETIEPGQDYEVVIDFKPEESFNLEAYYNQLSDIGTSIQVGEGDGMYRMHIHVPLENRYKPIDCTMDLGTIQKVYIENLIAQMEGEKESASAQKKLNLAPIEPGEIAVVAISPGSGISRIFASLGVAAVTEGGQTMNPSTKDILNAFENLPTDKVIILPNNKNIIMAAQSAAKMTVKNVAVIPTTNIPQGLNAMLRLIPDGDFDKIVKEMEESLDEVDTGEITVATRSVEINGVQVKQGEVIALLNGKLVDSKDNLLDSCLAFLKIAETEERERITLFYGDNITKNEVNKIVDAIRLEYPSHEIELHEGGQPHYQFIIAIE
jgi:uncharacterized protein